MCLEGCDLEDSRPCSLPFLPLEQLGAAINQALAGFLFLACNIFIILKVYHQKIKFIIFKIRGRNILKTVEMVTAGFCTFGR